MPKHATNIKNHLQIVFLDWINNFTTRERFAEYYGLTLDEANQLVELGRLIHERLVLEHK